MRISDVITFIARDPLVAGFLLLLLGMVCFVLAGLTLAFWRDNEARAEVGRRQAERDQVRTFERIAQAGTPRASGLHHRRIS